MNKTDNKGKKREAEDGDNFNEASSDGLGTVDIADLLNGRHRLHRKRRRISASGLFFWWRYTAGSLIRNRENLENGDVDERNSGKKESASFSPYVQHWQLLWERGILRGLLRP